MTGLRALAALGTTAVLLAACERVVSVQIDEAPKRLVVEGRILRVQGTNFTNQTIRLSLTSAYFDTTSPPAAIGAAVSVFDGVDTWPFVEGSPGVYGASFAGVVGREYKLTIQYAGETYESVDTLHAVAPIDSFYFELPTVNFDPDPGLRGTIDFTDTPNVENFYLWEQLVNGRRVFGPDMDFRVPLVTNDIGVDGRELLEVQPFGGVEVQPRDTVVMRQFGISRAMFNYYIAMGEQTSNDGSPFAVPPSSVRGNVRNLTNPARPALGYFFAAEVSEKQAVVP